MKNQRCKGDGKWEGIPLASQLRERCELPPQQGREWSPRLKQIRFIPGLSECLRRRLFAYNTQYWTATCSRISTVHILRVWVTRISVPRDQVVGRLRRGSFRPMVTTQKGTMSANRSIPSVLWHCWLVGRKGIRPVKITFQLQQRFSTFGGLWGPGLTYRVIECWDHSSGPAKVSHQRTVVACWFETW